MSTTKFRVRTQHVDHMLEVLREEANSPEVSSKTEICKKWNEKFNIAFVDDNELTTEVWKRIVKKYDLHLTRKVSPGLSTEQLAEATEAMGSNPSMTLAELADQLGMEDLAWTDLFVGYNAADVGKRGRKPSKMIDNAIVMDSFADEVTAAIDSFNAGGQVKAMIADLQAIVDSNTAAFTPGFKADARFTNYYLYDYKEMPRRFSRISKEQKEEICEFIRDMYQNSETPIREFADKINAQFGTSYSAKSIPPIMTTWKILENVEDRRRNRKGQTLAEVLTEDQINQIKDLHTVQCKSFEEILSSAKSFSNSVNRSSLRKLVKDLGLINNRLELTEEHKTWLTDNYGINSDIEELTSNFNKKFDLKIKTTSLAREAKKLVTA